jgi:hypothetical protein
MFGGLQKSTSLAALLAVAGFALSGAAAQAADLGGNCCADLEERIAELEATTARKGNRKVSLTVSGQVNEAIMFFDDGVEKNAYQVTNNNARTRFRFVGTAKIDAAWSAGYLLEIGVRGAGSNGVSQNSDEASNGLDVRHSAWWLQNKDLGKLWVGQTSQAVDGITEINLANMGHFNNGGQFQDSVGGFLLRNANGTRGTQSMNNLTNGNANPGEGDRYNVVKYETPTIAGFIASASVGEDKMYDAALRFAGEFSGFKLAAGVGYAKWTDGSATTSTAAAGTERGCARITAAAFNGKDVSCDEFGASASIMHVPTGLFATGAYGEKNDDQRVFVVPGSKKKDEFYWVSAGIEQKFFPVGKSTFYGEYFEGKYGATVTGAGLGNGAGVAFAAGTGTAGAAGNIASSSVSFYGVGFNQSIDAAAMDIYVAYRNYEVDVTSTAGTKAALNDLQTVYTGAMIKF